MFGRLGHIYFLHLAEAQAQRRRLAKASRKTDSGADANLAVFLRLTAVIATGLGAAWAISALVD